MIGFVVDEKLKRLGWVEIKGSWVEQGF